jgi:hypothetical protein
MVVLSLLSLSLSLSLPHTHHTHTMPQAGGAGGGEFGARDGVIDVACWLVSCRLEPRTGVCLCVRVCPLSRMLVGILSYMYTCIMFIYMYTFIMYMYMYTYYV